MPVMEDLDIHLDFDAFEDSMDRFGNRTAAKEEVEDLNIVAHFLTFIGKST